MRNLRLLVGRCVATASIAIIGIGAVFARPEEWLLATAILLAMLWGALPQALDAWLGDWPAPTPVPTAAQDGGYRRGSFAVAIVVGDEPAEVARASIIAASAVAPTVVVTCDELAIGALGALPVPIIVADSVERGLVSAADHLDGDALFVLSARAFVDTEAAQRAAGLIRDGSGWVVGRCRTFNDDGFAPLVRERLTQRLRDSARAAGLALWEPDATIVSLRLFREHPFTPGAPWGAALRAWQRSSGSGRRGTAADMTVAMSAEPGNARFYWPSAVLRRRSAAADLADALGTERGRGRWLAAGLLLRELYAYPLAFWLLTPWLLTRASSFPFRIAPVLAVVAISVPAALRWTAERHAHGSRVHPFDDLLALAFDAPGSALSITSVVTHRARPTRLPLPGQPLLLAGLAFAAITLVPLLSGGTTTERAPAVGLALTELALLWLLAVRATFQRNWARRTYRIRSHLPVRIGGAAASTLDISLSGLSVVGAVDAPTRSTVPIDLSLDDDTTLEASGVIIDRRLHTGRDVTGLQLFVRPVDRGRWITQLARASSHPERSQAAPWWSGRRDASERNPLRTWTVRALIAATVLVSALALIAACLTAVGLRPLIVRSGSMEPALNVGDVVLVEDIEVSQLLVGDIATIDNGRETLTHRVWSISGQGDVLTVVTKGDANYGVEEFALRSAALVGRVVAHVPRLGLAFAWAGTSTTRRIVGGVALAYIAAAVAVRSTRGRRKERRVEEGDDSPLPLVTLGAQPSGVSASGDDPDLDRRR